MTLNAPLPWKVVSIVLPVFNLPSFITLKKREEEERSYYHHILVTVVVVVVVFC